MIRYELICRRQPQGRLWRGLLHKHGAATSCGCDRAACQAAARHTSAFGSGAANATKLVLQVAEAPPSSPRA